MPSLLVQEVCATALSWRFLTIEDAARSIERVPEVRAARHPVSIRLSGGLKLRHNPVEIHAACRTRNCCRDRSRRRSIRRSDRQVEGRGHASRSVPAHPAKNRRPSSPFVGLISYHFQTSDMYRRERSRSVASRTRRTSRGCRWRRSRADNQVRARRANCGKRRPASRGAAGRPIRRLHPCPHPRVWTNRHSSER